MQEQSPKPEPSLEEWKQAVWDFLVEHSDVTDRGSLFVKFHTDGRHNFENRIKGRCIHGYHRKDTRLNMNTREKEQLHVKLKQEHLSTKKKKREKWEADRAERRRVLEEVRIKNQRNQILNRYPKILRPFINSCIDIYATSRTKLVYYKDKVLRTGGCDSQPRK